VNYLLDTNVVSELRKGSRVKTSVANWFALVSSEHLYLSVLVIGELRQGIERIRKRDAHAAMSLERWLTHLAKGFQDRILPIDVEIAEMWGNINSGDPLPTIDGLQAATALVHGMTLVTRNTRDVQRTGVLLLNPFGI
jgi:predicted nucleic acid-binding protein